MATIEREAATPRWGKGRGRRLDTATDSLVVIDHACAWQARSPTMYIWRIGNRAVSRFKQGFLVEPEGYVAFSFLHTL